MFLYTKNYKTFRIETAEGECIKEFSGAVEAGKALPGDEVEPTETGCRLISRSEHHSLSGLLEFGGKIRHGFTSRGVPLYLFKPYNEAYPPFLVASKETGRENQLAVIAFEHWDEGTFPRGGLIHILGPAGNKVVEKAAIAWQYSPWSWSKKRMPEELVFPSKNGRHVLDKPTINIDPPGCRDIDDLISMWEEDGITHLAISIADVAAFAVLNPNLRFAERIGQTLYTSTGSVIRPMFPPRFSEDLFSLLPGEERFVVSLFAKWDGVALYDVKWKECIVRNWASYTYENCKDVTEIDIGVLRRIVAFLGHETEDTHKWVEALMLFYNSEAGEVLKRADAGLLRIHGEPEKERMAHLQSLGLPAKELAYPAAVYATTDTGGGHWGLRKGVYCHASSPIRRYADVLNQEVLKNVIHGIATAVSGASYKRHALLLNRSDKAAKGYERDCRFVDCILGTPGVPVHGIVVEIAGEKVGIYCFDWNRMIRYRSGMALRVGDDVFIGFYANATTASWKNRIVYRVEVIKSSDTGSQEPPHPAQAWQEVPLPLPRVPHSE